LNQFDNEELYFLESLILEEEQQILTLEHGEKAYDNERRFDYVINHFGAGGDKYLGGENLLELLAFNIYLKIIKINLYQKEYALCLHQNVKDLQEVKY
jgi:hypothetical protein